MAAAAKSALIFNPEPPATSTASGAITGTIVCASKRLILETSTRTTCPTFPKPSMASANKISDCLPETASALTPARIKLLVTSGPTIFDNTSSTTSKISSVVKR